MQVVTKDAIIVRQLMILTDVKDKLISLRESGLDLEGMFGSCGKPLNDWQHEPFTKKQMEWIDDVYKGNVIYINQKIKELINVITETNN